MLKVEAYAEIRRAHRDGMSIRAIARRFHHAKKTVRKALARAEPLPYTRTRPRLAPKFGPFAPIVDAILRDDEQAPRKQRHTAQQVFRRLVSEHSYRGGYDQVRRYIQSRRRCQRETFIPLTHDPGQRAEADFGHIHVDFPEGRQMVPVLLVTWSYSNAAFAIALPTERTEAILHGLVEAFAFFHCVPRELWWDNPKTVAAKIYRGRDRRLNERYAALASHYTFDPRFCLPRRGNEKPAVEHRVFDLQRRWATPVPRVVDLPALNSHLRNCCDRERDRCSGTHTLTIGQRFDQDRAAAIPLPERSFDPCVSQPAKADKFQLVRFDHNVYSVPRRWAYQVVTIKAYVDVVIMVAEGATVARHTRSYGHGEQILDPMHYLATLSRRPAALDHAAVYRNWKLPAIFNELRSALEARWGASAGARQYIRVLQLLAEHPLSRVEEAIRYCRRAGFDDADTVRLRVDVLANRLEAMDPDLCPTPLRMIQVPTPDLSRFNQLLTLGDIADA